METKDIFCRDPNILGGTPVFTGTRVPVDTLIVYLKHGKRLDEFLDDFPGVGRERAKAFLDLAENNILSQEHARTTG